jgi:hypothetical protein
LLVVKREDIHAAVDSFELYYNAVVNKGGDALERGRVVCKMMVVSEVPVLTWCGSILSLSRFVSSNPSVASWTLDLVPTTLEPVRWIESSVPENHIMWVVAAAKGPMGQERTFDDVHLLGSFLLSQGITEHVLFRIPNVYEFKMRGMDRLPSDEVVALRIGREEVDKWMGAMGDAEVLTHHLQKILASGELGPMWVAAYVRGRLRPSDLEEEHSHQNPTTLTAAATTMRSAMSDLAPVLRRTPLGVLTQHPDLANLLALALPEQEPPPEAVGKGSSSSAASGMAQLRATSIAPIQVDARIADKMLARWQAAQPWTSTENVACIMGLRLRGSSVSVMDVLSSWEDRRVLEMAYPEITMRAARTVLIYDSILRVSVRAWKWIVLNHAPVEETNMSMLPLHYPIEAVLHVMRDPEIPVGWFQLLSKDVPRFISRRKKQLAAVVALLEDKPAASPAAQGPTTTGSTSTIPTTPWMEHASTIVKAQPDGGLVAMWEVLRDLGMEKHAETVIDLVQVLKEDDPSKIPTHTTTTTTPAVSLLLCSIFYAPHLFSIRGKVAQYMVSHRPRLPRSFTDLAKALTDESSVEVHPLGAWRVGQVRDWVLDRIDPFRLMEEMHTT